MMHRPENARALRRLRSGLLVVQLRQTFGPVFAVSLLWILLELWRSGARSASIVTFAFMLAAPVLCGLAHIGHLLAALAEPAGLEHDRWAGFTRWAALATTVLLLATAAIYLAIGLPLWWANNRPALANVCVFGLVLLIPMSSATGALWHASAARLMLLPKSADPSLPMMALFCGPAYLMIPLLAAVGAEAECCVIVGFMISVTVAEWLAASIAVTARTDLTRLADVEAAAEARSEMGGTSSVSWSADPAAASGPNHAR
ncbi:MAG: hypothetical protein IBJ11_04735 [Phycisphaerales bacterium]|nr:hypothetical protein [Phycisphaerales bacterium]